MPEEDAAHAKPSQRSLLRQQRSRSTRERLIRAAAQLWSDNGYEQTTVEDICDSARVARATYYLHFASKEQVLVELTWATASGVRDDVANIVSSSDTQSAIEAFVEGLARRMGNVPKGLAALVVRTAVYASPRHPPPPSGVLFEDVLGEIIRAGQDRNDITARVDAAELGAILSGTVMDALLRWTGDDSGTDELKKRIELRIELVLDGLWTEPASPSLAERPISFR